MRYGMACASRRRVRQAARAPGGERGVEALRRRADQRGAHGLPTERLDDAAHLPRGDALQVALGERAEEGLLVALVAREDGRREAAGAIARDLEHEAPHARDKRARAGAVPDAAAGVGALIRAGPEKLRELAGQ